MSPITKDDWLNALIACDPECDQSALTVTELGALLGKAPRTIRDLIPKLITMGKVEKTHKRVEYRVVPAYRLCSEGKGKRAATGVYFE